MFARIYSFDFSWVYISSLKNEHSSVILRQYFGIGGSEEWRIQDASKGMAGETDGLYKDMISSDHQHIKLYKIKGADHVYS